VRLLAVNGNLDNAIQNLADIIGNRALTRNTRWQAVWLAPELVAKDPALWSKLRDRVRTLNPNDNEMSVALESLSQNSVVAGAEEVAPNAYLRSLRAIIEKKAGLNEESRASFSRALIESNDSAPWQSFAFLEDEPLEQLVALYLKENQPVAALKVAERVASFQPNKDSAVQAEATASRYQTLHQRAEERRRASHVNLLELLSIAAEQLGDLNRAYELEQLRLALLSKQSDRDLALARLDHLRDLRNECTNSQKRNHKCAGNHV